MRELKFLRYAVGGGFVDEKDVRGICLELSMSKYGISCLCNINIGDKSIIKSFESTNYPILNNISVLLNKVNFDEIGTDIDRARWEDMPSLNLEYNYENDGQPKTIKDPNCKGLLVMLNDFFNYYLLKDEELQAIFKAIINCDLNHDYMNLKYIINNQNTFNINKDYEIDKINTIKPDMSIFNNTSVTNKSDNKEVTMDDLIAKIDEKIAEIEEIK